MKRLQTHLSKPAFWLFLLTVIFSFSLHKQIRPKYILEEILLETKKNAEGKDYYLVDGVTQFIENPPTYELSSLHPRVIARLNNEQGDASIPALVPVIEKEIVQKKGRYYEVRLKKHYGIYSLLPAIVAIAFCWVTREPLVSLFLASLSGAILLGKMDYISEVLLPAFSSKSASLVLILYLCLLGGILGLWARTGAAQAFANWLSRRFVRGPISARLITWGLGMVFFQGGTISTVLVGTTVKPVTDKQKISHEELSYIVDSTASPIACLLAFNAWPIYIQSFLYLPGVAFLATEQDRIAFFFQSLPFSFYSILAVSGTLLFCFDKLPFIGKRMRAAKKRARVEGKLDSPWAKPLASRELQETQIPSNYTPSYWEFILPILSLLGTILGTFFITGKPEVHTAFGVALILLLAMSLWRGMELRDVMIGIGEGWKGTIMGALILLFAIILGQITTATGGGLFLVEALRSGLSYWLLPPVLLVLTVAIAFSTGTSWGTYAVVYPLAMPLAWSLGSGLSSPELFLSICFAVVLNGSVIGDQSSPISDTTILSSMCTGCDLMDHVRTQIVPVAFFTLLAGMLWTIFGFLCV